MKDMGGNEVYIFIDKWLMYLAIYQMKMFVSLWHHESQYMKYKYASQRDAYIWIDQLFDDLSVISQKKGALKVYLFY